MNSPSSAQKNSGKRSAWIIGVIVVVLAAALLFYTRQPSPQVRQLNAQLASDAKLAAYPYPFRVLSMDAGTAVMSTPRSPQMSVQQMIKAIDPSLENIAVDDPRFRAAQQTLAEHQQHAASVVMDSELVDNIEWELDTRWLSEHGIVVKQQGLY